MKEEYLHFLWRHKRLQLNNLKLINWDKQSIQIIDTGWYNQDSGPDFFNGTVLIDGIKWSGNIEIHIKSSDWYAHQHQQDKAYNNVILHVVYEHDKEVEINGKPIPTIELKNQIDNNHYRNYESLMRNKLKIPCQNEISDFHFQLYQQIDLSFIQRMERKAQELLSTVNSHPDYYSLFLKSIFKAVGGKANSLPMQELSLHLSYQILSKERWDKKRVEALLFGSAGLLNKEPTDSYHAELKSIWLFLKQKHQLKEMNESTWKFGGMRPYSYPTFLLAQLSTFLTHFDFSNLLEINKVQIDSWFNSSKNTELPLYWQKHFLFGKTSSRSHKTYSQQFKMNLIINGIIPFLNAMKYLFNDFSFSDRAIEIIEQLPAEENTITKMWLKIGIQLKNALQSQGLLELNNDFCTFRKCMNCKVGSAVLSKQE